MMKWWKFPTTPVRTLKISAFTVPVYPQIELMEDTPYVSIVDPNSQGRRHLGGSAFHRLEVASFPGSNSPSSLLYART